MGKFVGGNRQHIGEGPGAGAEVKSYDDIDNQRQRSAIIIIAVIIQQVKFYRCSIPR